MSAILVLPRVSILDLTLKAFFSSVQWGWINFWRFTALKADCCVAVLNTRAFSMRFCLWGLLFVVYFKRSYAAIIASTRWSWAASFTISCISGAASRNWAFKFGYYSALSNMQSKPDSKRARPTPMDWCFVRLRSLSKSSGLRSSFAKVGRKSSPVGM